MLIVRLHARNKCGLFGLVYDGRIWILVHGYVLITATLGRALDVADEVAKIKGVKNAHAVTGAYDVIATFNVESLAEVADAVVKGIHHIEGVCATQTVICVSCK